jgi:hypothetical protein
MALRVFEAVWAGRCGDRGCKRVWVPGDRICYVKGQLVCPGCTRTAVANESEGISPLSDPAKPIRGWDKGHLDPEIETLAQMLLAGGHKVTITLGQDGAMMTCSCSSGWSERFPLDGYIGHLVVAAAVHSTGVKEGTQ